MANDYKYLLDLTKMSYIDSIFREMRSMIEPHLTKMRVYDMTINKAYEDNSGNFDSVKEKIFSEFDTLTMSDKYITSLKQVQEMSMVVSVYIRKYIGELEERNKVNEENKGED